MKPVMYVFNTDTNLTYHVIKNNINEPDYKINILKNVNSFKMIRLVPFLYFLNILFIQSFK